jgi:two-component system OmpR family response regulator
LRLLVVDDDAKLSRAVGRGLRNEGYAVDVVRDGEAALRQAAVWDYDGIVLDVMLPERDGFEVCRLLRDRGCWAPVLMLTARDAVSDRIAGLDAGADDYLPKPFDFGELLARLRALTRRAPPERPPRLEVGDLLVDPATREVRRRGEPVEELLARHPGEVISRSRFLEHVWDENHLGSTNIVDQYVGALRRKLEQPFGTPLIVTVRGVGFKLEPQP